MTINKPSSRSAHDSKYGGYCGCFFLPLNTQTLREVITTGGEPDSVLLRGHGRQPMESENDDVAQQAVLNKKKQHGFHNIDPATDHHRSGEMYRNGNRCL